jgi:hypothetical protein
MAQDEAICRAVQHKLTLFAPRINDAYAAFDADHSGNLSYAEFRHGVNHHFQLISSFNAIIALVSVD